MHGCPKNMSFTDPSTLTLIFLIRRLKFEIRPLTLITQYLHPFVSKTIPMTAITSCGGLILIKCSTLSSALLIHWIRVHCTMKLCDFQVTWIHMHTGYKLCMSPEKQNLLASAWHKLGRYRSTAMTMAGWRRRGSGTTLVREDARGR